MTTARYRSLLLLALLSLFAATSESGNWELEVHGGGMFTSNSRSGTSALPPVNATIELFPGFSSRDVSSWYFGDGPTLFNAANAPYRTIPSLETLDPVLTTRAVERPGGGAIGLRLTRRLSALFAAEVSVDYNLARLRMTDASAGGIERSRAGFQSTWSSFFLGTGAPSVSSTASLDRTGGAQILASGSLRVALRKQGRAIPFVSVGAGIVSNGSDAVGATIAGNYQFRLEPFVPGQAPALAFNETDNVRLSTAVDKTAFFGMLGAGLKYDLSSRWGLRTDLRGYWTRSSGTNRVTATPTITEEQPNAIVTVGSITGDAIRWVNFRNNQFHSTLSTPLDGFQTFHATGSERKLTATAGVYFRF